MTYWLAAVLLLAAPRGQPPPMESGSRVLVVVAPSAGGLLIDPTVVAQAIRLRLGDAKIEVLTEPRAGEPPWRVDILPFGESVVDVNVTSPSGREVRAGTLSLREREPQLVADTIALWAVEALTPVMPELSRQLPVIPPPDPGLGPHPPKQTEEQFVRFALRLGGGWQRLSPSGRGIGIFGVEGELGLGSHFAIVPGFDFSTKLATRGPTYALSGRRLAGTLALAGLWRFAPLTVFVHAGPMLRMLRFTASGDQVAFAERSFTDGGLQATTGIFTNRLTELLDVGVSVRVETYFAKPDLTVDGVEVLDSGAGALTLGFWLQHSF